MDGGGGGGNVLEGSVLGGDVWGMMFRRLCRGDHVRAWGWPSPACSHANLVSPPAACLLRSNALSLVYLLFLLLLPWLPGPSRHSLRGKGQAVAPAWRGRLRAQSSLSMGTQPRHPEGGRCWVLLRNPGQQRTSVV